jgi:hypothetical protein
MVLLMNYSQFVLSLIRYPKLKKASLSFAMPPALWFPAVTADILCHFFSNTP